MWSQSEAFLQAGVRQDSLTKATQEADAVKGTGSAFLSDGGYSLGKL